MSVERDIDWLVDEKEKRITHYVRNAIMKTKEMIPEHWNTTLDNRANIRSVGSYYDKTPKDLEFTLMNECTFESFVHPDIDSNCEGFITHGIRGYTGLIELEDRLSPEFPVKLENNKGNFLSCLVELEVSAYGHYDYLLKEVYSENKPTVLIIGEHNNEKVVFTFHAGDPVTPSRITGEEKTITAKEAISMGFDYAKVRYLDKEEEE